MSNKRIIIILLAVSIIIFGYFIFAITFVSNPGDPQFFIKHEFSKYQISTLKTDKEKAAKRLSIISDLVHKFDEKARKNPGDSHLVPIADEIIYQSELVTVNLTRMKDKGGNVQKEAELLCEALEKQVHTLKYLTEKANPNLQKALARLSKITQKYVDKAMSWE